MFFEIVSWAAVAFLMITSAGLLLTRDWRWSLGLLAAQYLGVFWLVRMHWPISMAAVKLVTGWMSAALLGITRSSLTPESDTTADRSWPEGRLFRVLAAALVLLTILPTAPRVATILPGIGLAEVAGSLLLLGMGLLHLGMTIQPLRVIIGLLTILAGFEMLYAAVETSTLVAALLAVINLGLALVGSYLLTAGPEKIGENG
ncbi:MAG: hypothetical protein B6I38_07455 [Anaerolineaceae bacterium 4572_5.1]|nr:MAG: hypothetical protein B6I38_07455 [Anaerolineaceae bacterium 4572_5.1]